MADSSTLLMEHTCNVCSVNVTGNKKTDTEFLKSELKKLYESKSVGQLAEDIIEVENNLRELDIFSKVEAVVDVGPKDIPDSVSVDVSVVEKSSMALKTGVYSEGSEGSMELAFLRRNLFGRGEKAEANVTYGSSSSSAFRFNFSKPRFWESTAKLDLGVFKAVQNNLKYHAHQEYQRGASATVSTQNGHSVKFETVWREITNIPMNHPLSTLAGHSLKTSLSHTYTVDDRDDPMAPSEGQYLSITNELAGFGGDAKFFKSTVNGHLHIPLTPNVSFSVGSMFGIVLPLSSRVPSISDRFYLGGPLQVRGFRSKGIGPRAKVGDKYLPDGAVGGDVVFSASSILSFDFPSRLLQLLGVRGQVFGNIGNCAAVTSNPNRGSLLREISKFSSDMRCAVGFGLAASTRIGRLEANYCIPIVYNEKVGDRPRHGFQVGLGVHFG